jgi:hypothetical protein
MARRGGADARGRLTEDPFSWRATKDGSIRVNRGGREVTVVRGTAAVKLRARLDQAADEAAVQQVLARVTGHYRHAN